MDTGIQEATYTTEVYGYIHTCYFYMDTCTRYFHVNIYLDIKDVEYINFMKRVGI